MHLIDFRMKRQVFSKTHPKKGFLFGKNEFLTINILITCDDQIKDIKCLFDYYYCQMKNVNFILTHHVKRKYILFLKQCRFG